jgi:hypothetical protein
MTSLPAWKSTAFVVVLHDAGLELLDVDGLGTTALSEILFGANPLDAATEVGCALCLSGAELGAYASCIRDACERSDAVAMELVGPTR